MTSLAGEALEWQGCTNARDLGGLPTVDGGRTRRRALYRSAQPSADGVRAMQAAGVVRVVDLRSTGEAEREPSPLAADPAYRLVPMVDPAAEHLRDPGTEAGLLDSYLGSLRRNGRTITAGIAAVADAPPGPVLVHCRGGKDRTGMLVALLLRLVGVTPEAVVADYAASHARLAGFFAAELAAAPDDATRARLRTRQHARAETMSGMLDALDRLHGGVEPYCLGIGVTADRIVALRHRLREPRPSPP